MSVAKVTEISSEHPESFDAAIKKGVERANKTLRNVQGAWVNEQNVKVKDGKIAGYRVNLKVTFLLED